MDTKLFVKNNKISISILLFIVLFGVLHWVKPPMIYNRDGSFKQFGIGYTHKSVLPIWIWVIVFAILSYLAINYYLMFS